jgi:hypothetical protein
MSAIRKNGKVICYAPFYLVSFIVSTLTFNKQYGYAVVLDYVPPKPKQDHKGFYNG